MEGEMRCRKMFSALGGMQAALIFDTGDVEQRAVCFFAAFHRSGTETANIQLTAALDPADPLGISYKDLECCKLNWM